MRMMMSWKSYKGFGRLITGVNKIMEFGDKRRGMGILPGVHIQLLCDLKLIVGCDNTCFHHWGVFY